MQLSASIFSIAMSLLTRPRSGRRRRKGSVRSRSPRRAKQRTAPGQRGPRAAPSGPAGCVATRSAAASGLERMPVVNPVSTTVGAIALTYTWWGAHSTAKGAGQGIDRALAGAIVGHPPARPVSSPNGRDVHDLAAASANHLAAEDPATDEGSERVHLEGLAHLLPSGIDAEGIRAAMPTAFTRMSRSPTSRLVPSRTGRPTPRR